GSSGQILSASLGSITVQAYNGSTAVGSEVPATSAVLGLLASGNQSEVRLPAPGTAYDRIRVKINSGLLSALTSLRVYHGYYLKAAPTNVCSDTPVDVLTGVSGNLASVGSVSSLYLAVDGDESTFSNLNLSVGVLGPYVQQTVVFPGLSPVGDSIRLV